MAALLDRIRRAGRPPWHTVSTAEARAAYEQGAEVLDLPRVPLARVQTLDLALAGGRSLRVRLYAPSDAALPVLLYLHGGGFVVGSLETHDALCRQWALRAGCAVVALDYRLAPEHPFPAAVEDAWQALQALPDWAQALGLDGRRVAVAGDSAGGTLATVAAILARDAGLPLALQLLVTPGTTAHADTASHRTYGEGYLLDAQTIAWFFDQVLPPSQRDDWRFSPLNAPDLEGVAPVCLVLAECDPLVDEGLAYGDRLRAAGVPVELELARGVTHDFIKMGRQLPEAHRALDVGAAALRRAFALDAG